MTLTIDKKQIDFTLENEQNLSEVIENVNKWLGESQLIIETLLINNEDYSQKELSISLDEVNSIEIGTLSFRELNINNISWIKYFLERFIHAVEKWNVEDLKQIKLEIPFVSSNISTLLSFNNSTPETVYSETLLRFLDKYNYFQCKEEIVDKKEIIDFLKSIVLLLNERVNEFINPIIELKAGVEYLYKLKDELESVSLFLQSGKNEEAAQIMNKFTNIFNKVLRILNFNLKNPELIGLSDVNEFTEGLDDILNELLDGYESQDTVLIGDILEYELAPRIETLNNIFN